ncbi:MAG: ImmA/IrrE family metallo-endopeptidase [Candidatus Aminicenantes bacterium]|nr:ImmA/IrrE family metallo-endopeptidase [Candidatus Aminicenantes bacterium]
MSIKKQLRFEPDYAVPPGVSLQEVSKSLGMGQKELALRTSLTVQTLNRIYKGVQPITYETANRLELVTGVPARFWNNLESQYREQLERIEEKERLVEGLEWLKKIPLKELLKRKVVQGQKDSVLQLREVLTFYGVSSVEAWKEIWERPAVAARRSQCFNTDSGSASAWIRIGELKAQRINCQAYDKAKFETALREIRSLTCKEPDAFEPKMQRLCADAGVALALVKEMPKVPWNGATKWLTPTKAMIILCLRGKGEDRFWFSFFHEAGHVLHDSKKDLLINDGSTDDPRELIANDFAKEFLIPGEFDSRIIHAKTDTELIRIAKELNISRGIVAGRYQFLTKKWNFHKHLIRKFSWDPSMG